MKNAPNKLCQRAGRNQPQGHSGEAMQCGLFHAGSPCTKASNCASNRRRITSWLSSASA